MDRRQLTFDLSHAPSRAREDFVVTPANRAAFALVEGFTGLGAPGLVIVGPTGSGKSHLAAIFAAAAGARLTEGRALDEAGAVGLAGEAPAITVDDADRVRDLTVLFHLLNAAREAGVPVMLTATAEPASFASPLPDLLSRLAALPAARLDVPDDLLLTAVMAKQFADRQLKVEPDVIAYLATRMERSLGTARRLVEALDAISLAEKREITKPLAARVLEGLSAA